MNDTRRFSKTGDPLERLASVIGFELFRPLWMPHCTVLIGRRAGARLWAR